MMLPVCARAICVAAFLVMATTATELYPELATSDCDDGEVYDWDNGNLLAMQAKEFAMLFSPPEIPWRYKSVCVYLWNRPKLHGGNGTTAVTVSIYSVNTTTGNPNNNSYAKATLTDIPVTTATRWFTVPVAFDVYTPYVYLTVKSSASWTPMFGMSTHGKIRRTQLRTSSWYSNLYYNTTQKVVTAASYGIRALGAAPTNSTPPSAWNCSASLWKGTDGVCTCGCGAWDPDCSSDIAGPVSSSCASNQVCSPAGVCVNLHGWNDTTTCKPKNYGSFDGCHCGCGGDIDPDCLINSSAVNCGSMVAPVCNSSGVCTETWTCDASYYNDGICHCGCGVPDPDCNWMGNNTVNCPTDSVCVNAMCRKQPATWVCRFDYYNKTGECDCNCGAPNPTCATASKLYNCFDTITYYECTAKGTCVAIGCGNDIIDTGESCDGGLGCSSDCACNASEGYIAYSPVTLNCQYACGNGKLDLATGEKCDGGLGCNNCTCSSGYISISSTDCQYSCGNGQLDSGEQCDNGTGCSDCTCQNGYISTSTVDCEFACGNNKIDTGEECDSTPNCTSSCKCESGFVANSSYYCVIGCGNGEWDLGEQCDGGLGCTDCVCGNSFITKSAVDCAYSCGNSQRDSGEECDGGVGCTNCTCDTYYVVNSVNSSVNCMLACGNSILDALEECDSGIGCNDKCTCKSGYQAMSPLSTDCEKEPISKLVYILPPVLGGAAIMIIIASISVGVYCRRRGRKDPKKLNIPMEHNELGVAELSMIPADLAGLPTNMSEGMEKFQHDSSGNQGSDGISSNPAVILGLSGAQMSAAVSGLPVSPPTSGIPKSGMVHNIQTVCDDAGNVLYRSIVTYDEHGTLVSMRQESGDSPIVTAVNSQGSGHLKSAGSGITSAGAFNPNTTPGFLPINLSPLNQPAPINSAGVLSRSGGLKPL